MDRLKAIRAFVTVVSQGGFAAAARDLGVSPPVVTRAIADLEEHLGARLLHRTTRKLRLTEAGTRFFDDSQRILAELDEAETSAKSSHGESGGHIAVTASQLFGRRFLAPIVADFLVAYPQVTARTLLVDRVVDLVDEGLDVAVRIAHLPDSTLRATRVGSVRRVVCASPKYLSRYGTPKKPADLAALPAVAFTRGDAPVPWKFVRTQGTSSVMPKVRLFSNAVEGIIAAAVDGQGVTQVLSYQVIDELRTGRLQVLLVPFERPPLPVHVLHLEGRRVSAKVRTFVDFAVERLRKEEALRE